MSKLAINGGEPVRKELFPNQAGIGYEEKTATERVIDSQMLSGYRGNWEKYRGGKEVQKFEEMWSEKFGNKHSIAINSCTSALQVACMAIGLKPGDEVIVTPYSMTCSATAPMICGATPVFADVEPDYFCLDPEDVERKITDRTKAIIAIDLFGQPFSNALMRIAEKYNLFLIEDAAQAPGASIEWYSPAPNPEGESEYIKLYDEADYGPTFRNKIYTGNLGHIGCFSFTQGKHMTAGEGGMITTNDDVLAMKCRLIMNHAEAVINDMGISPGDKGTHGASIGLDLWGLNLRMTEIQAAILQEQLKKLDFFIGKRNENADYLAMELSKIPCIVPAPIRPDCTHTFYVQAFLFNTPDGIILPVGFHRDTFINAVKAELQPMAGREDEGVRMGSGYIKPLYRMPVFGGRFHNAGEPQINSIDPDHFPVVEKLWTDELFLHLYLAPPTNRKDLDDIIEAFWKVWESREELKWLY